MKFRKRRYMHLSYFEPLADTLLPAPAPVPAHLLRTRASLPGKYSSSIPFFTSVLQLLPSNSFTDNIRTVHKISTSNVPTNMADIQEAEGILPVKRYLPDATPDQRQSQLSFHSEAPCRSPTSAPQAQREGTQARHIYACNQL